MKGRGFSLGFTLIELLIVVAIIAILAAIAVPNFIEAQTRSKVSRAKSDLRSIATAMESYMVDWNTYIPRGIQGGSGIWGKLLLTTPVGYITSLPKSPFLPTDETTARPEVYDVSTSGAKGFPGGDCAGDPSSGAGSALAPYSPWPKDMFIIVSGGPKRASRMNVSRFPNRYSNMPAGVQVYDASNGSVSDGKVLRWMCPGRYNPIFEVGYDPSKVDPTNGAYERWKTGGY